MPMQMSVLMLPQQGLWIRALNFASLMFLYIVQLLQVVLDSYSLLSLRFGIRGMPVGKKKQLLVSDHACLLTTFTNADTIVLLILVLWSLLFW